MPDRLGPLMGGRITEVSEVHSTVERLHCNPTQRMGSSLGKRHVTRRTWLYRGRGLGTRLYHVTVATVLYLYIDFVIDFAINFEINFEIDFESIFTSKINFQRSITKPKINFSVRKSMPHFCRIWHSILTQSSFELQLFVRRSLIRSAEVDSLVAILSHRASWKQLCLCQRERLPPRCQWVLW